MLTKQGNFPKADKGQIWVATAKQKAAKNFIHFDGLS